MPLAVRVHAVGAGLRVSYDALMEPGRCMAVCDDYMQRHRRCLKPCQRIAHVPQHQDAV